MVSFEGTRQRAAVLGRTRSTRYVPLYIAAVATGLGIALGASFAPDRHTAGAGEMRVTEPYVAPVTSVAPESHELMALTAMPSTFTSELPTAFTDNFDVPAPEPSPIAVAPEAPAAPPAPASRPLASAPAAAPVEQPQPAAPPAPAEKPNFYLPDVPGGGMTGLEQRLFDGMNAERANAGLPAYSYDAGLSHIARIRAQQMADQGYFAHVDPNGYSMYTELLARFGYSYAWAGENLALNNYSVSESPERAMVSLMKSATHAANILAGDFYRVGVGEVTTADGRHIYAMIFLG